MRICILAVTKAYDGYCIAGMTTDEGEWIRPIPSNGESRFWKPNQLTTEQHGFLRVGDVLEFDGQRPQRFQHPNHTEDFEVLGNMTLCQRFSNEELINFLQNKEESEQAFHDTVHARGRSLCLVKVDGFRHEITQWHDDPPKPKMTFTKDSFNVANPKTDSGNYIVKDCKLAPLVLNNTINNDEAYDELYLAIGLATKFNGTEYPQVVGLHSEPSIPYLHTYPN
ncbi:hypothetical protein [Bacillus sp. K6W]|uniref:dual OB domain-containing protein n=1 Tax=Bacillus sp. K6W TaxID=2249215 RepID=UPI000DF77409|nr:hypothetical protein [Bacillus sp. K6W]